LEIIEDPVDARRENNEGEVEQLGQWNVVFRKVVEG
jgi:hypothetical protein